MKPEMKLTVDDILSIMNATVNADLISRCKREIKKAIGSAPMWDSYRNKWVLVG